MATTRWLQGATPKVLGIGFLALLMLVPLGLVNGLVHEREGRAQEAVDQIAARWGSRQNLGGPVLVVPVRQAQRKGAALVTFETREYLLPDQLSIRAELVPEVRRYGMYEAVVYLAQIRVEGRFLPEDLALLEGEGRQVQWSRAQLRVPVSDVRGIRRVSALHLEGRELAFGPDPGGVGDSAAISVPLGLDEAAAAPIGFVFGFELTLAGSEQLAVLPLARQTDVQMQSVWPNPGFDGAFLPATRTLDASGFKASWQVLDLNRPIARHWDEAEAEAGRLRLADSAFGVSLVQRVGAYQQNVRTGKYGVLFVALTFVVFFLFEVLRKLRVHPVQYLLVGAALCTFYVVLLALSEQIGFALAYLAAAAATIGLIGGYASVVLSARRAGFTLALLLGLVYALLYGLVQSEDYALLMGSLALLIAVAALMYLTRWVDWYAMGSGSEVA